jgi:DNA-binding LacI/PurR family transcriptional regulator
VRDVAVKAGVSTQTVSRVINESPSVRAETRARVLAAMEELGFRANNAARALGTRSTRTLGVIASDAELFGPSIGIAALDAAARSAGRWIATAYADAVDETSVLAAADRLLGQGVDALIALAPHGPTLRALRQLSTDVPIAALHSGAGGSAQAEGAALAVAHLVTLGHRRIAWVGGPPEWVEAGHRDAGVERALADARLSAAARFVGDWTARSGLEIATELVDAVRSPGGVTAVAVANDQMALGVIAGLTSAGICVPEDVSVTGFDDNPDAAFYRPALTTVRIDIEGEARRCVAGVLGLPDVPTPSAPLLVVRASTGPAAA